MHATVVVVFAVVYFGMMAGRIPGLAVDRTGIAILGAIALVATGHLDLPGAWAAVDASTIALLLGLMVLSAQLRLSGFYTRVVGALAAAPWSPAMLLAGVIALVGVLAAVLVNDVVCLVAAPVLVHACARRHLDPVPFLLALACAANIGSAATLIGNPQNMLVGQRLGLSFTGYLGSAAVPAVLGLGATWLFVWIRYRHRWNRVVEAPAADLPAFDGWEAGKGLVLLVVLVGLFALTSVPRDVSALATAGLLLTSRRMPSRRLLAEVDWQLLALFAGLFVVNHVLAASGVLQDAVGALSRAGVDVEKPAWLFVSTAVLSNLVSNVPAVMLLLPVSLHPQAGPILALSSTLAGSFLLAGSIANLIVVDEAARLGVRIGWREHARVGAPVALCTLGLAAAWLWLLS